MKVLIDFIVLIIVYFVVFFKKWKLKGSEVLFLNTTMYVYLSFVLYFTLMPVIVSLPFMFNHPYSHMNIVPFIDVSLGRGDFVRQVLLNVIMTVPFGILLPLVKKNVSIVKVILYSFVLSFVIEILQPLINGIRSSDITDIITNVVGAVIGYACYLIFKPLINKVMKFLFRK